MFKGLILGVVLTLVAVFGGAFLLVMSGFIPPHADAKPTGLETWLANASLEATLRRKAPKDPNPVPLTDQNLIEGIHLFARNCAVCHGSAKGTAAASPIAKGLYQKPPQLATDGVEDDPEGESYWKIRHGIRLTGMPAFGHTLNERQIWTLALFLKHMDKLPPAARQEWEKVQNWPIVPANQAAHP